MISGGGEEDPYEGQVEVRVTAQKGREEIEWHSGNGT